MLSSLSIPSQLLSVRMHQSTAKKGSKYFLVMTDTSSLGLAQKCGSHADSTKAELLRKENSILGMNLGTFGLEVKEQGKSMKSAAIFITHRH